MPIEAPREPYAADLPDDPIELEPSDETQLELRAGTVTRDLAGRELRRLDLTDVRVERADWANLRAPRLSASRCELRGVRLTGAQLADATLRDVVFTECRLDLVGLRAARLERVAFRDCRLEELDLYGTKLIDVTFEDCVLREATISAATFKRCAMRRCDLASLRGAEQLGGVQMTWDDVLANAPVFAGALGVVVVE